MSDSRGCCKDVQVKVFTQKCLRVLGTVCVYVVISPVLGLVGQLIAFKLAGMLGLI